MLIREFTLHLCAVKQACETLIMEISKETDDLTFGLPVFDIPDDLLIYNELRSREPHFGFLDHARNPFAAQSTDLLLAIITHPDIEGIFDRQSIKVGAVGSRDAEIGGEVVVTRRYRANALGTVCPSKLHGRAC